jgi:hypothetical protein
MIPRKKVLRRPRRAAGLAFAIAVIAAHAGSASADYKLRQDSTAGTGVSRVYNACFSLSNTVGEAVAGPVVNGNLALYSGFWGARPPAQRDSLMRSGFEDCGP